MKSFELQYRSFPAFVATIPSGDLNLLIGKLSFSVSHQKVISIF